MDAVRLFLPGVDCTDGYGYLIAVSCIHVTDELELKLFMSKSESEEDR